MNHTHDCYVILSLLLRYPVPTATLSCPISRTNRGGNYANKHKKQGPSVPVGPASLRFNASEVA